MSLPGSEMDLPSDEDHRSARDADATYSRVADLPLRIERCELEVGAWQTGMLLIDTARAAVVGNRVRLPRPAGPDAVGQGIVR